jgi:hypothetical protein
VNCIPSFFARHWLGKNSTAATDTEATTEFLYENSAIRFPRNACFPFLPVH